MITKFQEQQAEIRFYTVVLCQDKEFIPRVKEWLNSQKDLPYLPEEDMFAYYCPICNVTLDINHSILIMLDFHL